MAAAIRCETNLTKFGIDLALAIHSHAFGGLSMALSFARDIRPLFRDTPDVETMKNMGLDLSSYEDVKAKAEGIYSRLEDGTMPCDSSWPKERVATFKRWMDVGMGK
jgi:hypothetical protein